MPMAVDTTRSALYPTSGGLGYYNLGQTQFPIQHYPYGMPHQTYQTPVLSSSMFKNEERADPRTHGLRPTLYSQYQSAPSASQMYSYVQPYSYEYSSPLISGSGSHYSGYSSYPYYRDAEEEKPRQFNGLMPTEKYIAPVRPSVQYTSKYLMGRPFENYESLFQPQMMQPMQPMGMPMSSPLLVRNSMPVEWNQGQERAITFDDQLQMQVPNNYLLEKLQRYTPSNEAHSHVVGQPLITRAAEEPKPLEWSQSFIGQPMGYKTGGLNQLMQDPYISPEDRIYIEPFTAGEPTHPAQGSRSDELMMMNTYPNHEQQLKMAQMQYYHNAMNNIADHIEPINREYVNQRMFIPHFPAQMEPLTNQRMLTPNTMGSRSMEDHQKLLSRVQEVMKNVEAYVAANQPDNKNAKIDPVKEDKKR
ncbi:hypothetical protein [Providencia sp. PROV233]|uniref:hypothetical protein n=1 Tax=Providencia sp. PROV233 TaxID=2949925 RepID=UPI00234B5339|nr:hypothetical protein [Providencia sp. PROV233]